MKRMPVSLNPHNFEPDANEASSLPVLVVRMPPRKFEWKAWRAIKARSSPAWLFVDGQTPKLCRVLQTRAHAKVESLTLDLMMRVLVNCAIWIKGPGKPQVMPPRELACIMLAHENPPLPLPWGVTEFPFYSAGGQLVFRQGYNRPSQINLVSDFTIVRDIGIRYCGLPAEQRVVPIMKPFRDPPFSNSATVAHLLALMLTPLFRQMIQGPAPLFCANQPLPDLDGMLLVQTAGTIITGDSLPVIPPPDHRDRAELRRLVTSALRDRPGLVLFGN